MRLATDQLETAILSVTGFALKIEEKQLTKSWKSAKAKIHEDNSQNTDYSNKDHWFKYFENNFCTCVIPNKILKLNNLQSLKLYGNFSNTDEMVINFKKMPNLTNLYVNDKFIKL